MSGELEGRTILITGAASGIGAAYTDVSARNGARLVLIDRDGEGVEAKAAALRAGGSEVATFSADISDPAQVDSVFDEIQARFEVDGAFLNAGVNGTVSPRLPDGEIDVASREIWNRVIGINLDGFFYTLQRTAGMMKPRRRGTIVVTGSTSGVRAEPLIGYAYIASKSAVHAVSRQAALELSKYGIRLNVIAPGSFRTNIAGPGTPDPAKVEIWNRGIPLGRHGETPELEELALLLISEARSSFMTGGVYVVDGGASVLTQITTDLL
ncbi:MULTISPECIES: SDR family NAD(P)-dependent oxidoreductase [unclassified Microbacterium]|uniref:SDR family NAD(P)-dependent oxidoreductase n=1 Tax=unclassified Microbacterium TaxID=2609290 RepID=UPI00301A540A